VRELRNNVAAVLRRAAAGERIIVTLDGRPTAQLGPLEATAGDGPTLDDLIATGLAEPPTRPDRPRAPTVEDVPVDVRAASIMDELRGR
jgi:prevent-host-death family protein